MKRDICGLYVGLPLPCSIRRCPTMNHRLWQLQQGFGGSIRLLDASAKLFQAGLAACPVPSTHSKRRSDRDSCRRFLAWQTDLSRKIQGWNLKEKNFFFIGTSRYYSFPTLEISLGISKSLVRGTFAAISRVSRTCHKPLISDALLSLIGASPLSTSRRSIFIRFAPFHHPTPSS